MATKPLPTPRSRMALIFAVLALILAGAIPAGILGAVLVSRIQDNSSRIDKARDESSAAETRSNQLAGYLRGDRGLPGVPGPFGAPGKPGGIGLQGPRGFAGAIGRAGAAGAIGVDGANGTNGANGERGPQGPQGEQGPAGPPPSGSFSCSLNGVDGQGNPFTFSGTCVF